MRRVPELDGLRGVAILLVVLAHASDIPNGGKVGVTLFFVLSGYLITALLLRELDTTGAVNLRAFWGRRARRILPAMVLPLLLGGAVIATGRGWGVAGLSMLSAPVADYVLALGFDLGPLRHLWSLAIEEQFYLVWPVALAFLWRRGRLTVALCAVAVAAIAWRLTLGVVDEQWAQLTLGGSAFALVLGSVAAAGRWRAPSWVGWVSLAALVAASVGGTEWTSPFAVAVGLCGLGAVTGARGVFVLRWGWLRALGVVSYGWYLWHYVLVESASIAGSQVGMWVGAVVSLGIAAASWRWLERPILQRKKPSAPAGAETGGEDREQGARAAQ